MKLWFDEDLSPTLVQIANALGFEATCNRDRGALGISDSELRARVELDGYVLVTDNASDCRPMYVHQNIHHGLIAMPGGEGRQAQQRLARDVIAFIANAADHAGELPAEFMINKLVEIGSDGGSHFEEMPNP